MWMRKLGTNRWNAYSAVRVEDEEGPVATLRPALASRFRPFVAGFCFASLIGAALALLLGVGLCRGTPPVRFPGTQWPTEKIRGLETELALLGDPAIFVPNETLYRAPFTHDVTLHFLFVLLPNELPSPGAMRSQIEQVQYCFAFVVADIDVPVGRKNLKDSSAVPSNAFERKFVESVWREANTTADFVRQAWGCPRPQVLVRNIVYGGADFWKVLGTTYTAAQLSAYARRFKWAVDREYKSYKTNMGNLWTVLMSPTNYVLHVDGDSALRRRNLTAGASGLEEVLRLMASTPSMLSVTIDKCEDPAPPPTFLLDINSVGNGNVVRRTFLTEPVGPPYYLRSHPFQELNIWLATVLWDLSRFKRLLPQTSRGPHVHSEMMIGSAAQEFAIKAISQASSGALPFGAHDSTSIPVFPYHTHGQMCMANPHDGVRWEAQNTWERTGKALNGN